jgi:hypothetical protein
VGEGWGARAVCACWEEEEEEEVGEGWGGRAICAGWEEEEEDDWAFVGDAIGARADWGDGKGADGLTRGGGGATAPLGLLLLLTAAVVAEGEGSGTGARVPVLLGDPMGIDGCGGAFAAWLEGDVIGGRCWIGLFCCGGGCIVRVGLFVVVVGGGAALAFGLTDGAGAGAGAIILPGLPACTDAGAGAAAAGLEDDAIILPGRTLMTHLGKKQTRLYTHMEQISKKMESKREIHSEV